MLAKITVDDKQARQMLYTIQAGSRAMSAAFDANKPAIAAIAANLIRDEIADIPTIGPFLAPRTKIEVTYTGSSIVLTVSGKNEAEAGFPPVSGGKPTGEMNLWAYHEYGAYSPEGEIENYVKDEGGVTVQRKSRSAGAGSMYRGVVRDLVPSITSQLNIALRAIGAQAAHNIVATVVETASRGKVKIPRSAKKAMQAAGISGEYLAALGGSKVGVTKTGQIYVIGQSVDGTVGFMPSKALGIPTTIRTQ